MDPIPPDTAPRDTPRPDATGSLGTPGSLDTPVALDTPVSLDTRGLDCPLPILKAKKALAGLQPGDHLRVEATDPGALMDFPAFCRQAGHTLLSQETVASARFGAVYRFLIAKGG